MSAHIATKEYPLIWDVFGYWTVNAYGILTNVIIEPGGDDALIRCNACRRVGKVKDFYMEVQDEETSNDV